MPSIRNLLVRFRFDVRLPEPPPVPVPTPAPEPARNDHVRPAVRPVKADATPRTIRVAPTPPDVPPRCEPTPDLKPTAPPAPPVDGPRVSKLDALTPALGRRKAGQALWAPQRLTKAEHDLAAKILKDLDQ